MGNPATLDEAAAMATVREFAAVVFESNDMPKAMRLMTLRNRREWAADWVVGELEQGNLLDWSEREEVTQALTDIQASHRVWNMFANATLSTWREMWKLLPEALRLSEEERSPLRLRDFRTMEDLLSSGNGTWIATWPSGPHRIYVDFDPDGQTLLIEDINVFV